MTLRAVPCFLRLCLPMLAHLGVPRPARCAGPSPSPHTPEAPVYHALLGVTVTGVTQPTARPQGSTGTVSGDRPPLLG